MRKTIYQAISPSTVLDRISSRLRKCVDINLIGNNPVHLIVFPPESRNVVAANAIKKALSQLKLTRKDIKVKIVSEEQKGLFGMDGAKPAKIIVTIEKKD